VGGRSAMDNRIEESREEIQKGCDASDERDRITSSCLRVRAATAGAAKKSAA
jgi:hypothetical protein